MEIPDDLVLDPATERVDSESGADVLRVKAEDGGRLYAKVASGWLRDELAREHEVLVWLNGRFNAPRIHSFFEAHGESTLITHELPGQTAEEPSGLSADQLLTVLASTLRELHALPVRECPFNRELAVLLAEADERVAQARVDLFDLDDERAGWSAEGLLAELHRTRPTIEELVFSHGDLSLPNLLLSDGRVSGLVDWGGAGVSDRYRDIALLERSLRYNHGGFSEAVFCDVYGIDRLDWSRVRFYQLLDEFF